MGDLVEATFGEKQEVSDPVEEYENDVWLRGPVVCRSCKHEWADELHISKIDNAECPACGLHRGTIKYNPQPSEGWIIYSCHCGCEIFYLSAKDAVGDGQCFKLRTTDLNPREFRSICAGCGHKANPITHECAEGDDDDQ